LRKASINGVWSDRGNRCDCVDEPLDEQRGNAIALSLSVVLSGHLVAKMAAASRDLV
jgi:hypothetical protein